MSSTFQCPLDNQLKPIDGSFRDSVYCGIYYNCINGIIFPQQCPPGLAFAVTLKNCNYQVSGDPDRFDCANLNKSFTIEDKKFSECARSSGSKVMTGPCYIKNSDCDNKQNSTVPNKKDCRQYYNYYNGVALPQQCPEGYFFGPVLNVRDCTSKICVPLEEAKCPIPGAWSEWSMWSDCEPKCGDGLRARTRECSNPPPSNGGAECPGNAVDLEVCFSQPCNDEGEPCFMVSLTENGLQPVSKLKRHKVNIDNGDLFKVSTNSMNVSKQGFYFMSLTATCNIDTAVSLSVRDSGVISSLNRGRTLSREPTTTTRAALYFLNSLNQPFIFQDSQKSDLIGSNSGSETSWLSFLYDTDSTFFGANIKKPTSTPSLVSLDSIVSLRGVSVSNDKKKLTVLNGGWFYISFGGTSGFRTKFKMGVQVSGRNDFTNQSFARNHKEMLITHQLSRGFLIQVNDRDSFSLVLLEGNIQNLGLNNYIIGFKLKDPSNKPAFYAYRNNDFIVSSTSKIQYDIVILDSAGGWDSSKRQYTSSKSGTYYVDISIGVFKNLQTSISVKVNNRKKLGMRYLLTRHKSFDTMSRGGLLKLQKNDKISITTSGSLYNSDLKLISFVLFYI